MAEPVYGLSARAAADLAALRAMRPGDDGRGARGLSSRVRFVQCISATAVGSSGVLGECYPGRVVQPAADALAPGDLDTSGGVLLTVIGSAGTAVAPTANAVYLCVITDDTPGDGSGSLAGRPRAFGIATGGGDGDVVGPAGATDNALARFDGTSGKLIQNSIVTFTDAGVMSWKVPELATGADLFFTLGNSNSIFVGTSARAQTSIGVEGGAQVGSLTIVSANGAGVSRVYKVVGNHATGLVLTVPDSQHCVLLGTPDTPSSSYAVVRGSPGSQTTHVGADKTIAPGDQFVGGLNVGGGSGSFLTDPGDGLAGGTYS